MESKGIQISDPDRRNGNVLIRLEEILPEISNPEEYIWCLQWFYGCVNVGSHPVLRKYASIEDFSEKVNQSKTGLIISWQELCELANILYDLWDIVILGSKTGNNFKRHRLDSELYSAYDIAIVNIDGGCWEIFSKNDELIDRFKRKFHMIKSLKSNEMDWYLNQ